MLEQLKKNYFFAVIRGKDEKDAVLIARHAVFGGIKNIEITFSTPNAEKVIQDLNQEFSDDLSVFVGAGTVMSTELAQKAIDAGAKFLVSPHFSIDIQKLAVAQNVLYFPGCATATEIASAHAIGCPIIKLFPGGVLGPSFIKDIHGPMPDIDLMPSGGVSVENVSAWKKAGACAVGIGSALASRVADSGYESVTEIARSFVEAVEG
ncbi:bifunctional 4-hydroxy-2-oxoglutarate aldolase/2-dehydro-3-deoxy-phosphogluconate aldolase [Streptococcus sp. sy018]|uniref:bifunctional 4-hydroxy-2-oxoglutarate aldolase/2-dehydro-3-deoxy-phosphogluconate aldolase n=1 Tax=Streptococcus sp. sy018 TaxID=2600147 RepID=UPI0011B797F3|nr:bifunctional 4-hydroxy-2-oxoglutarate aldolase/2-dehydro-3-deoxy-phosphogluconate aldolase [Streptococcus sp. sy018]TWS95365.1 bifunctional 4-hydroxy-2-oxoglutarate aldolase/2-dehydro-3-deoxy-phosphogluconate aldolase [Streptococcus sp. sy018]